MSVPNAIELDTLKWFKWPILCFVTSTTMKREIGRQKMAKREGQRGMGGRNSWILTIPLGAGLWDPREWEGTCVQA